MAISPHFSIAMDKLVEEEGISDKERAKRVLNLLKDTLNEGRLTPNDSFLGHTAVLAILVDNMKGDPDAYGVNAAHYEDCSSEGEAKFTWKEECLCLRCHKVGYCLSGMSITSNMSKYLVCVNRCRAFKE